jgi:hypothetical protein
VAGAPERPASGRLLAASCTSGACRDWAEAERAQNRTLRLSHTTQGAYLRIVLTIEVIMMLFEGVLDTEKLFGFMSYRQECYRSTKIRCPGKWLTRRLALAAWIGVRHGRRHLIHSVREVGRERSLHLRKVCFSLLAIQDDSLGEPRSSISKSFKSPMERQACAVQLHLDRSLALRGDLSDEPV